MNEEITNEMVENMGNVEVNATPNKGNNFIKFGIIAIGAGIGAGITYLIRRKKNGDDERLIKKLEKKGYVVYKPEDDENTSDNGSEE